ncbi:hypothetical protein J2T56_000473 [Natronobacillus azotifigens]|uniref:Uncharacterized protein n=1 Tax=Natronobacillus azotifigens TaxID=472978 RepID=A0A9J6RDV0_9BACI|nr:hypothetical protein [Natronobacillus azotifigens]MCZ0703369.1 hypothetical protein [Natronobacillus azotifigens]
MKLNTQLTNILNGHSLTKENLVHGFGTRSSDRYDLEDLQDLKLGSNSYSSDTDNDGIPYHRDSHPRTPNKPV